MSGYQGTSTRGDITEALRALVEAEVNDRHTAARGKIVAYNAAKQTATVKPLMKVKVGDKDYEAPELMEVPVRQPKGGGMAIHMPIKAGDEVDLTFYSRPLDAAHNSGESTSQNAGRRNDISDAVATPAGSGEKSAKAMPTDGMHIGLSDGSAGLKVKPDGTFDMKGKGDSLMSIIEDLAKAFRDHTNLTAPLDQQAGIQAIISRIQTIKAS